MPAAGSNSSFRQEVIDATPGGETLVACLQCGTCGGSCPSGADMDHTPRRLIAMIEADQREQVMSSNTPWFCVSCYYCMARCPKEIPITDIMYTLKRMSIREELYDSSDAPDWSQSFIGMMEQYGRSFELGLATRYHLTHKPLRKATLGSFGISMLTHDRLALLPDRIKNLDQFHAILEKAKELEAVP